MVLALTLLWGERLVSTLVPALVRALVPSLVLALVPALVPALAVVGLRAAFEADHSIFLQGLEPGGGTKGPVSALTNTHCPLADLRLSPPPTASLLL